MTRKQLGVAEARGVGVGRSARGREGCVGGREGGWGRFRPRRCPWRRPWGTTRRGRSPSGSLIQPFDNSSMDGYAVRAGDPAARCGQPVTLPSSTNLGPVTRPGPVAPGEAIAISTGAMLPEGADAVVRGEDTGAPDGASSGTPARGRELTSGRAARTSGRGNRPRKRHPLGPAALGLLASIGCEPVPATGAPRPGPDRRRRAGRPARRAAARAGSATRTRRASPSLAGAGRARTAPPATGSGDDREATRVAVAEAIEGDVAVVCGGVSVGEHDHVRPALEELGVEQVFWGVSLRPGKPTWFGPATARGRPGLRSAGEPGLGGRHLPALRPPGPPRDRGLDPPAPRPPRCSTTPTRRSRGRAEAVRVTLRLPGTDGWSAPDRARQASHF